VHRDGGRARTDPGRCCPRCPALYQASRSSTSEVTPAVKRKLRRRFAAEPAISRLDSDKVKFGVPRTLLLQKHSPARQQNRADFQLSLPMLASKYFQGLLKLDLLFAFAIAKVRVIGAHH
jgi:hypothetical protein